LRAARSSRPLVGRDPRSRLGRTEALIKRVQTRPNGTKHDHSSARRAPLGAPPGAQKQRLAGVFESKRAHSRSRSLSGRRMVERDRCVVVVTKLTPWVHGWVDGNVAWPPDFAKVRGHSVGQSTVTPEQSRQRSRRLAERSAQRTVLVLAVPCGVVLRTCSSFRLLRHGDWLQPELASHIACSPSIAATDSIPPRRADVRLRAYRLTRGRSHDRSRTRLVFELTAGRTRKMIGRRVHDAAENAISSVPPTSAPTECCRPRQRPDGMPAADWRQACDGGQTTRRSPGWRSDASGARSGSR
jgi:hypothetical protein